MGLARTFTSAVMLTRNRISTRNIHTLITQGTPPELTSMTRQPYELLRCSANTIPMRSIVVKRRSFLEI